MAKTFRDVGSVLSILPLSLREIISILHPRSLTDAQLYFVAILASILTKKRFVQHLLSVVKSRKSDLPKTEKPVNLKDLDTLSLWILKAPRRQLASLEQILWVELYE
jgi:hypothetical protein